MLRFNPDKIARLVSELRKALERLRALAGVERSAFLQDADKIGSAKYNLIVAIESAIDICNHIISQNGYRTPEDYADTFQVLGDQGVFSVDFTKQLKDMAKFRNRLTHLYWEVDDAQVYEILQSRLDDFKRFLGDVAAFLKLENY